MALNHQPVCRICRREGRKLYLKGDKCVGPKCTFDKKAYAPGMHGRSRRGKISQYGIQLREKQKIRETYGLLERQFHRFFTEAQRKKGVTGENLLGMLESRLDNVVYRIGFASSRRQARQLVRHRHFLVNDRIVNIPSFVLRANDRIRVRERFEETGCHPRGDAEGARREDDDQSPARQGEDGRGVRDGSQPRGNPLRRQRAVGR